ncbi:zinc finger, C2H2 type, partial [Dictyocaulus viviparus]
NHRDSCRKCGSFLCLVCDEVFVQRVQLDRHWIKMHFITMKCDECSWVASAPLRMTEHAFEIHKKKICGYCGAVDPSVDHITSNHWIRLKKSVPLRNTTIDKNISCGSSKSSHLSDSRPSSTTPGHTVETLRKEDTVFETTSSVELNSSAVLSTFSSSCDPAVEADFTNGTSVELRTSDSIISQLPAIEKCCFFNVIVNIPDDAGDSFHFGSRLPIEIQRLFPELSCARVCFMEPFVGKQRCMALEVPVSRPLETNAEMERLLSTPIYI